MKRGPWPQWGRVSPDEQILTILRQAEGGMPVAQLCREHGSEGKPRMGQTPYTEVMTLPGSVLRCDP